MSIHLRMKYLNYTWNAAPAVWAVLSLWRAVKWKYLPPFGWLICSWYNIIICSWLTETANWKHLGLSTEPSMKETELTLNSRVIASTLKVERVFNSACVHGYNCVASDSINIIVQMYFFFKFAPHDNVSDGRVGIMEIILIDAVLIIYKYKRWSIDMQVERKINVTQ